MFEHFSKIAAVDPTSAGWAPDELLGLVSENRPNVCRDIYPRGICTDVSPTNLGCSSSCAAMVRRTSAISISMLLDKRDRPSAPRVCRTPPWRGTHRLYSVRRCPPVLRILLLAMIPRGSHVYYWVGQQLIYQFGPQIVDDLPHLIVTQ